MRRVCLRPLDDPRRVGDDLAVVDDEHGYRALPADPLDLSPPVGDPVHEARADAQAADLDHLGVVAGQPQRLVGVVAGMAARAGCLDRRPADVELHAPSSLLAAGTRLVDCGRYGVPRTPNAARALPYVP